jgi:hypothetical protein
MLRRVALVRTDVSEESSSAIIKVTRIDELGTTIAVASNRRTLRRNTKYLEVIKRVTRRNIPEDGILYHNPEFYPSSSLLFKLETFRRLRFCLRSRMEIFINVIDVVRFEDFTAVTKNNGVFWVVTPCGSCKNRSFGGTWRLLHQGDKNL